MGCLIAAFENYFVPMHTDPNYYRNRWLMASVDFKLSYGMFDGERLVGFIINAIDTRDGEKIAFNTGTGVLPAYRGKRIVKLIYEYALGDLKKNGVTKSSLEVVRGNVAAVKAYESVGFAIVKHYRCYQGKLDLDVTIRREVQQYRGSDHKQEGSNITSILRRSSKAEFKWHALPNQDSYSWDFQRETIVRGNYDYYYLLSAGIRESYFIIDRNSGNVAQFDVLTPSEESWNRLFLGIQEVAETVKIINVAERLTAKIAFLEQIRLTNTVNQYEMEMAI
jgi:GNAT superfamily N-acetyltransferase